MDPVTAAILAALTEGATSGLTEVAKNSLTESYKKLKEMLFQKFGHQSSLPQAVNALEKQPDSENRQGFLQEEIKATKADQDPEILQIVQAIKDQLPKPPVAGTTSTQNVSGHHQFFSQYGDVTGDFHEYEERKHD
jgi:hypothetical protein